MKHLLLISLFALSLFSLTVEDAIQRAIQYNPDLKEKAFLLKASKEESTLTKAGFKPTLDLSYGYNKFSKKNFVGADSSSSADATLRYNLFNGFEDRFNLKAAKENEKAAQYAHDAAKADLRLQVYLAYINYLRSRQNIAVAQDTITLLKQQLDDAKNFFEQGIFAKNDYLQVDVELSSAQQALLNAQRDIKLSFYALKRLLGSELKMNEPIAEINRAQKGLVPAVLHEIMLNNRSELKLFEAQRQSLGYSFEAAASNYYPKLDAELKYQVAGEDFIPNGGATFQTHDQGTASLYLNWNLYQGGAEEAKRASLLYQESASSERLNALVLELDFQLEESLEAYSLAQNQIKVAKKALEQAKENFRITKEQFNANIANTSLMLDAQRFLARTQVDYYAAYFALYDAMAQIERVVEKELF